MTDELIHYARLAPEDWGHDVTRCGLISTPNAPLHLSNWWDAVDCLICHAGRERAKTGQES